MSEARSRRRKKRLNLKAARMLLEGKPVEEVEKATGLRMFDVEGMRGWLRSEAGKRWAVEKGLVHQPKECAVKRVYVKAGEAHVVVEDPCDELDTLKRFGVVIETEDQAQDELAQARRGVEEAGRRLREEIQRKKQFQKDMAEIERLEAELLGPRRRRKRLYDLI